MATLHHCLYDMMQAVELCCRMRKEMKLFVNCVISHQKLKNMEFRGNNLIRDFLLNFASVKVIYFDL